MKDFIKILTASQTAVRFGYSEQFTPPPEVVEAGKTLWEKVVSRLKMSYFVSSWYRCDRLNKKVRGSKTSDHVFGRAVDLDSISNATNKEIFDFIRTNCEFDQLIWEFGTDAAPDWVHVSYRKNGCRNQVLRAYMENGKTKYRPI